LSPVQFPLKIIARPKKHEKIIARPKKHQKSIARPKKHQKIIARSVLLQNWSPVLFLTSPFDVYFFWYARISKNLNCHKSSLLDNFEMMGY